MTTAAQLELTWLGQSCFRVVAGDERVLIDPFLTARDDRRYPPPVDAAAVADTTLVLCTHEHDDHLDLDFLRRLAEIDVRPPVVVPAPIVGLAVDGGLDPEQVIAAQPDSPLHVGGVDIDPLPACHAVGGGLPIAYGFNAADDPADSVRFLGYLVRLGGVRVFHAGDTLVYPGLAERLAELAPDLLLLPISGRDYMREAFGWPGNMNEHEAAWLCREVNPAWVIPMHYDAFANNLGDPGRFVNALGDGGVTTVLIPARGRSVRLTP